MNADILVDRVHKYYWCKVLKKRNKEYSYSNCVPEGVHFVHLAAAVHDDGAVTIMMILVVVMTAMTRLIGAAGAQGGVDLVDLAAPLRSPVRRCEAQDRPAAYIPQVSCCQELALKQDLMKCWHCKKGVGVRIKTVRYRT